jgi:hypothetical protein
LAAISGTVVNRTTGKPQAGATVGFYKLGEQNGLEMIDQAKSDAQGNFSINQVPQGPSLIRTAYDGVTYNHMLPPGSPTTGLTLDVFNSSKQPGGAKVTKHMILFQPSGGQMAINETFLFTNDGKTAWNDPDNGTLHFYLPAAANGKAQVNATAPGGMPIGAALVKSSKPDVFGVDFAIKPGETRIDLDYAVPYTEGEPYQGKIVSRDENTYLVVPNGVTLTGDGLNDLGAEPQTQSHIFGLTATAYKIALSGSAAAAPESASADSGGDSGAGADGPQIEETLPHVFGQAPLILGLALGILALGFAILYRASSQPKETNERRRG